ncbi:hypothetical protein FACS1894111_04000 [Clostridia bacterium]|nr:hypothetical protein FACS1894111_04000 [Clostridia bacterium]
MQFVKIDDLKPGMRLARPIYNKMGVKLYERDTALTPQTIASVDNFDLIGIYILEPAEPVPPMTEEELAFEQFQTVTVFQLREIMTQLRSGQTPKALPSLTAAIFSRFGSLDHRIHFLQNIRSTGDFIYKHSLNTSILSALIVSSLSLPAADKKAIITAALLQDLGRLLLPPEILEKGDHVDKTQLVTYQKALLDGFALLEPDYNTYMLPDLSISILRQLAGHNNDPTTLPDSGVDWLPGSQIILTAKAYDSLTAMRLGEEPLSGLSAVRRLVKYPAQYPREIVVALTQQIHILPTACCVDLSDGDKGLVLAENTDNFMMPVVIKFSDNLIYDLASPKWHKKLYVTDIMKTMDNRIQIDESTLQQFFVDPHTKEEAEKFRKMRAKMKKAGRL